MQQNAPHKDKIICRSCCIKVIGYMSEGRGSILGKDMIYRHHQV
jgi:hypothetical protein